MKKVIALLLSLALVISCAACASTEEAPAKETAEAGTEAEAETPAEEAAEAADNSNIPSYVTLQDTDILQGKKIGNAIAYKGDEWCAILATAMEEIGAVYGVETSVDDGELNDELMTKQVENMITSGCDMIMIDPATAGGCTQALNKAYDAGIPIIVYDAPWELGEEKAVTTISWDQVETGRIVGEYLVDYIKENMDGKARILELAIVISEQCQERFIGLHEVIDKANAEGCEIEIVGQHDSNGNRETAYNAVSAIVEPYDIIVSDVDNGAMGAISALEALGNTEVKVLSMGSYGEAPFALLHDNDQRFLTCLCVDPWTLAQWTYDAAIAYYNGEEQDAVTYIDLHMVDASNVDEFWNFE